MARSNEIAEIKDGAVYIIQAGTPVYVKTADICAWIGTSNQWVGQLTSQGTLAKTSTPFGKMYQAAESISAYTKMLEERAKGKNTEIEEEKQKTELALKKSKATVAALQAMEMTGKMHRSEDVADMTEDLVYTIRNALLALPGRLAVDLAGMSDPAEISEHIRKEVYKVMDELSRYKYDPAKYEERVRERLKFDTNAQDNDEEEED